MLLFSRCSVITIIFINSVYFLIIVQSSELLQKYDTAKEEISFIAASDVSSNTIFENGANEVNPTKVSYPRQKPTLDYSFLHAFIASISVIIVSELGDKTFFIAAIMAMRHSRLIIFTGAIAALSLMTVLSVFLGYATTIIPRKYTFYISTALFAFFGLKMLKEGYEMDPNEGQEEMEEVSAELKKKEAELEAEKKPDLETGIIKSKFNRSQFVRFCTYFCSPVLIQAFTMTFLAEWGDRSQLTTIILGSRENPIGVTIGGVIGHSLCTGLAVLGGRLIAQRISVRTVTLVGGALFLCFAISALFIDENGDWSPLITACTH